MPQISGLSLCNLILSQTDESALLNITFAENITFLAVVKTNMLYIGVGMCLRKHIHVCLQCFLCMCIYIFPK